MRRRRTGHAAKCAEKTRRGNVYLTEREAALQAAWVRQGTGNPVQAYCCPSCRWWHVGKSRARVGRGKG